MRFYWYVSIVKIILYAVLGLISFMIIVPELFIFTSLALNSEKSSVVRTFPKSNIGWIDDIPISINKFTNTRKVIVDIIGGCCIFNIISINKI